MPTNLFQHITTSNDIHLLCDKQYLPATTNYTLLVTKGWADIEYNHALYHLTPQMVLFGSFTAELVILALSPDWQCNIIINPTSQMDETIYSCLQVEKEWHKKLQFLHAHPVLTISSSVREHMQQALLLCQQFLQVFPPPDRHVSIVLSRTAIIVQMDTRICPLTEKTCQRAFL